MSKLININTLYLAIVARHVLCSFSAFFSGYLEDIRFGLTPIQITTEYACNIAMIRSKGDVAT